MYTSVLSTGSRYDLLQSSAQDVGGVDILVKRRESKQTRPVGMVDPEHKDEEGASRSHIQESGDNSSSLSHSLQKKDEDTCLPHPEKTEEDKTSLQQTDEYTSHLHPQQVYVKDKFKYQPIAIEKASSDPSQRRRNPLLSAASHATPSQAGRDLYYASQAGDQERVKRLLSTPGDDVNYRGWWSRTPVMWAALRGHRDVVELLVSKGADVSLVDEYGDNICHWACWEGYVEIVKYVLSLNVVDIDDRNNSGQTAADRARDWGHQLLVDLLLSRGAQ
ncbi:serine/threonine-protein phosphatase 6 regulatory ankyrin repeat subunit C-like [Haliotis cracherodii]|uniref:serine/threonine-protein phosphatase 6 regulatory ankyrin repeat subunit C-like n=1 Tax=Haliotis cracherodii TaxID=6455 RepID=UPI0039EC3869